jgi:hypothetical protein
MAHLSAYLEALGRKATELAKKTYLPYCDNLN